VPVIAILLVGIDSFRSMPYLYHFFLKQASPIP
jgi:hypothetical protein